MSFNDDDVDLRELAKTPVEEILDSDTDKEVNKQQDNNDIHYDDEDTELFFGPSDSHEYEDTDLFFGSIDSNSEDQYEKEYWEFVDDYETQEYDERHLSDHAAFDDLASNNC